MTIFETLRAYAIALGLYILSSLYMLHAVTKRASPSSSSATHHPSVVNLLVALFCVIFFFSVLKRSSNVLEKIVMVVSSLFFVLWALSILSEYGYAWATVPQNSMVSLGVCVLATILVAVRTLQLVTGDRHHSQREPL
jgi:hypothetical protein